MGLVWENGWVTLCSLQLFSIRGGWDVCTLNDVKVNLKLLLFQYLYYFFPFSLFCIHAQAFSITHFAFDSLGGVYLRRL